MAQEKGHVEVKFQVKPNALPAAVGLVCLGIVCLGISAWVAGSFGNLFSGTRVFALIFSVAFIAVGAWLLCSIPLKRLRIPRLLSAQGLEFRNGKVIPWEQVSSIAKGPEFLASGSYYLEQTDIDLNTGTKIALTSDWIENYSELHEYLAARPEYKEAEKYAFSPAAVSTPVASQAHEALPIEPVQDKAAPVPTGQVLKAISELPRINVEISLFDDLTSFVGPAVAIGLGLFLCAVPFFVRPKGVPLPMSMTVLLILVGLGITALGCYLPFLIRNKRKDIPRFFSAEGVGIRNGGIVPWEKVYLITDVVGTRLGTDGRQRTFRQSNIKVIDGKDLSVSSDVVSNFDELHDYLTKLPQYEGN